MKVEVSLFGVFRDHEPAGKVVLELPEGARIAELRAALLEYAQAHWPGFRPGLLQRSAFASETSVLRDNEPVPGDGRMAVLPPVSGG